MSNSSFIGVDWGSTNLRAYLLDYQGNVLGNVRKAEGLLNIEFDQFESVLKTTLNELPANESLPVLLCGMVGSQQGWREAAYVQCPAAAAALANHLLVVPNSLDRDVAIVPGVSGESFFNQFDVMRGEETQVFGALNTIADASDQKTERIVMCLPGTHSKWVLIDDADSGVPSISSFATCMTGELHSVLMQHSILGRTVHSSNSFCEAAFDRGIEAVKTRAGLLHQLFSARSNVLDKSLDADDVGSYLSGVLIGDEVSRMTQVFADDATIYLVGDNTLSAHYQRALDMVGKKCVTLDADDATRNGLFAIAKAAGFVGHQKPRK